VRGSAGAKPAPAAQEVRGVAAWGRASPAAQEVRGVAAWGRASPGRGGQSIAGGKIAQRARPRIGGPKTVKPRRGDRNNYQRYLSSKSMPLSLSSSRYSCWNVLLR